MLTYLAIPAATPEVSPPTNKVPPKRRGFDQQPTRNP